MWTNFGPGTPKAVPPIRVWLRRPFASTVRGIADHIERVAGHRPCAAFRPHAGWRTWAMYTGIKKLDYRLIGWSWMLWEIGRAHV